MQGAHGHGRLAACLQQRVERAADLLAAAHGGVVDQPGDQGQEEHRGPGRQEGRRQPRDQHLQQVHGCQAPGFVLVRQVGNQEVHVLPEAPVAHGVVQQELQQRGGAQLAHGRRLHHTRRVFSSSDQILAGAIAGRRLASPPEDCKTEHHLEKQPCTVISSKDKTGRSHWRTCDRIMRSCTLPITSYTSGSTRRRLMTPRSRVKAATCAAAPSTSDRAQVTRKRSCGVVGAHSGQVRIRPASSRRHSCPIRVVVVGDLRSSSVMASPAPGAALAMPARHRHDHETPQGLHFSGTVNSTAVLRADLAPS